MNIHDPIFVFIVIAGIADRIIDIKGTGILVVLDAIPIGIEPRWNRDHLVRPVPHGIVRISNGDAIIIGRLGQPTQLIVGVGQCSSITVC